MNRLRPASLATANAPDRDPDHERSHWEHIAEEAVARVFQTASAGLSLPGSDGRRPEALPVDDKPAHCGQDTVEASPARLGFCLGLSERGTSFTPSIGAAFRFQALRQLVAASGRQLGLKGVIVVRGQVVLLQDAASASGPLAGTTGVLVKAPRRGSAKAISLAEPAEETRGTLLGQAELVLQPTPASGGQTARAPALCPLWAG